MNKNKFLRIALSTYIFFTPISAISQGSEGVKGITMQALPNAVAIEWQAPGNMGVAYYKVYYSKQSILENNGRFDDAESTTNDMPSFVLMDLNNRGYKTGDQIYVSVAAVDPDGNETDPTEEANTSVIVPSSPITGQQPHAAGSALEMQNAIALSDTEIKIQFSDDVMLPQNANQSFTVTKEGSNDSILIVDAMAEGSTVILITLPMEPLVRYTVVASINVANMDGDSINPQKSSAMFVGREGPADAPPPEPPASSSASSGGPTVVEPSLPASSSSSSESSMASVPSDSSSSVSSVASVPPVSSASSASSASSQPIPKPPTVEPEQDTTAPEDPTNLTLKKILQADGLYTVTATWKESADSDDDLKNYNLYESKNRGRKFIGPTALAALATSVKLTDVPPGTLTVKLTAYDETGNESEGIEEEIVLPETGGAALLLSLAGAGVYATRRKKRH